MSFKTPREIKHSRPPNENKTPILPQDVAYQSMLTTAEKLKEEKRQRNYVHTHIGGDYGNGNNDMARTMQTFLANMGKLLKWLNKDV